MADVTFDVVARDHASQAFDKAGRSADGLGGKLKDLEQTDAFDKAGKSADGFGSKLKGVGGLAAGAFGIGAVATFGKALFDQGVQLEAWHAKAEIVFGDNLATVETWAKDSANALGLTKREAVFLAANMSDLLVPMGFARDAAAGMSTDLLGLAGALSSWSGGTKSAQEVAEILTAALLGERDALQSLGISISADEIAARLAAEGKAELTGKALQQAEAMATLELITEKSTDAQNAFKDSTVTTSEQLLKLKGQTGEYHDSLSALFLDIEQKYIPGLLNFGASGKGLQGVFRDLGAAIDESFAAAEGDEDDFASRTKKRIRDLLGDPFGIDEEKPLLAPRSNLGLEGVDAIGTGGLSPGAVGAGAVQGGGAVGAGGLQAKGQTIENVNIKISYPVDWRQIAEQIEYASGVGR